MTQTSRPRNPRLVLFNVCVGLFMVAVDQRVLLVALPTLTGTFGTDLTTVQWTLLIYDLTLIGLVITVGRVGDLFGRKRIYITGFLLFIFGSALCGLSHSPAQLILFRCLQAIGGAMLTAMGGLSFQRFFHRKSGEKRWVIPRWRCIPVSLPGPLWGVS